MSLIEDKLARLMMGEDLIKDEIDEGPDIAETLMKEFERFLSTKEGGGKKKITGFHASYGYRCKRRWVLLFQGAEYEKKFDDRTQRIFDNGHSVHERWRNYFKDMGILIDAEVEVKTNDPVPIRGHADGILAWDGDKILYELKSINSNRFEFRRMYRKPDEKTYNQTQLYLYALKMDRAIVIYENKDNQTYLMFVVEKDEKNIEKQLKRFKAIYKMYTEDKVPARPYKRESDECQMCDLERFCWDTLDE